MKPYKEIIHCKPQKFLRMTGITQKNFSDLYDKIKQHIENEKKLNPLKRRGLKSSRVSLQDCILLALYYIRHYPTFQVLGNILEYKSPTVTRYIAVI
ncbi:MAG: transposase family protein [Ghiorsea sp.]|nr:transposase family protein [Ghiorsea sp.]